LDISLQNLIRIVSASSAKKFEQLAELLAFSQATASDPAQIYEAILQLYLFNGFPVAIESIKLFKTQFPDFKPNKEQYNVNLFEKRGIINCKMVYNNNFDKLQVNISSMSPDLAEWMIIEGYGKVLGRSGLTLQERELLNVAMLCTNYSEHQLHSHIRGAFNTGTDYEMIKQTIDLTGEYNSMENIDKSLKLLESIKSPH
jgi:alkylhydroperoxidase/carboxymuconolactone decarboxylase family protein YurZ